MEEKTIFKRIIDKEIPSNIVYEDELCLAFHDVSPQAPVHVLVIPKTTKLRSLDDVTEDDVQLIGHIFAVIREVARQLGIADGGYRVVSNCGEHACQTVPHLHFHLIGGRDFTWPPG
ncbi:MAG: histidine triad nucleotide-binding protein [Planctomycetia bacterium]|nr:histidine triad nucleotide-binding protein [Planctomycetia bacterium]